MDIGCWANEYNKTTFYIPWFHITSYDSGEIATMISNPTTLVTNHFQSCDGYVSVSGVGESKKLGLKRWKGMKPTTHGLRDDTPVSNDRGWHDKKDSCNHGAMVLGPIAHMGFSKLSKT